MTPRAFHDTVAGLARRVPSVWITRDVAPDTKAITKQLDGPHRSEPTAIYN